MALWFALVGAFRVRTALRPAFAGRSANVSLLTRGERLVGRGGGAAGRGGASPSRAGGLPLPGGRAAGAAGRLPGGAGYPAGSSRPQALGWTVQVRARTGPTGWPSTS
ncbi:hypothetical protein GCM10010505_41310 [Kitasatospora aburaviensis]